jgi:hypothetical protein
VGLLLAGVKAKAILIIAAIIIIGLLIFYISLPISDTKLISDVKTTQSSNDYRSRFLALASDDFTNAASNNQNRVIEGMRNEVVQIALKEVGTREGGGGNTNAIKYNDWYQPNHTWLNLFEEYCAIFTLWVFDQVGIYKTNNFGPPLIDSASCNDLVARYMSNGRFALATSNYEPKPGDLILFTEWVPNNSEAGYNSNHVGIVVDSDDTYVYTVEGNTSIPSTEFQRSGNGVYSKKHLKPKSGVASRILGYAVPWYDGEDAFKTVNGIPI